MQINSSDPFLGSSLSISFASVIDLADSSRSLIAEVYPLATRAMTKGVNIVAVKKLKWIQTELLNPV